MMHKSDSSIRYNSNLQQMGVRIILLRPKTASGRIRSMLISGMHYFCDAPKYIVQNIAV